jgi:kynurenine formamidase
VSATAHLRELLAGAPSNWGRWGPNDEVGALNLIGAAEVLAAVATVTRGRVLTLQVPIGAAGGDVAWPGRSGPVHLMTVDRGSYEAGAAEPAPGGLEAADDELTLSLQGTTHTDALGHVWYDETLYNGYPAATTTGGLDVCSVLPLAERGIVGRGVLLDIAAHREVDSLTTGDLISLGELLACAKAQRVTFRSGDILLLRTGWLAACAGLDGMQLAQRLPEPGLVHTPELVEWFHQAGVAHLVTDTLANEATLEPRTGIALPLHAALMRNLGIGMTEVAWLDGLADTCRELGRWEFLYVAAALKVSRGTGAPTNPVAIL